MQGALTQEYLESFEEAQHSRRRSGPQNYVANFQDITLATASARIPQVNAHKSSVSETSPICGDFNLGRT